MTNKPDFAPTPNYVLRSDNQSIFPTVNFDSPETSCVCVYGFSDKPIYDEFILGAGQLLTPYPLVKRYLANQIADAESADSKGEALRLVLLDATDPNQSVLLAATMATVLQALEDKLARVAVEYEFVFDSETACYKIKDGSKRMEPLEPIDVI